MFCVWWTAELLGECGRRSCAASVQKGPGPRGEQVLLRTSTRVGRLGFARWKSEGSGKLKWVWAGRKHVGKFVKLPQMVGGPLLTLPSSPPRRQWRGG